MGAWDIGVYDDDTAYEAIDELKTATSILSVMEKYFDDVNNAEYIGYDEGNYALVAAAVIDSVTNNTTYRCDNDDYSLWIESLKTIDFSSVIAKAIKAVDAITGENSELKELWQDNEKLFNSWLEDKQSIKKRLVK